MSPLVHKMPLLIMAQFTTSATKTFWNSLRGLQELSTCFLFCLCYLNLMSSFAAHLVFRNAGVASLWLTQLYRTLKSDFRVRMMGRGCLFFLPCLSPYFLTSKSSDRTPKPRVCAMFPEHYIEPCLGNLLPIYPPTTNMCIQEYSHTL